MPRRVVAIVAALTVVAGAILFASPLLGERTRIAAVATPPPVSEVTPIRLPAESTACARRVLLSPRTQVAQLVADRHRGKTMLVVTAEAPGFKDQAWTAAEGTGQQTIYADLATPKRDVLGRLCVTNRSGHAIALVGTREFRTMTRAITSVDGKDVEPDLALTFFTSDKVSVLGELGTIADRIDVGRGFLGHTWIIWFVLVLAFVGVPVAVGAVVFRALGDDR